MYPGITDGAHGAQDIAGVQMLGEGTHAHLRCSWAQSRTLTPRGQGSQEITILNKIKPQPPLQPLGREMRGAVGGHGGQGGGQGGQQAW